MSVEQDIDDMIEVIRQINLELMNAHIGNMREENLLGRKKNILRAMARIPGFQIEGLKIRLHGAI